MDCGGLPPLSLRKLASVESTHAQAQASLLRKSGGKPPQSIRRSTLLNTQNPG